MNLKKTASLCSSLLPVVKVVLLCTCVSIVMALFNVKLCLIPLGIFVVCCLGAPFFPQAGFYLPVISRGCTGCNMVALTFDDGPDPATTPIILKLLDQHNAKATFFVIGEKARNHPDLMREIIARRHEVGNHSYHHDVLLMLRPRRKIASEILMAQKAVGAFGIMPRFFRPPAGITNWKLGSILKREGLHCITFSCRAFDAGNRNFKGLATRILKKAKPDDIILLHDVLPNHSVASDVLIEEFEKIFSGLKSKNLQPVSLGQLIAIPMISPQEE